MPPFSLFVPCFTAQTFRRIDEVVGEVASGNSDVEPVDIGGGITTHEIALMSILCHPSINPLIIKCGLKMVDILIENNLVLNPMSPHLDEIKSSFKDFKSKHGAVYAKMTNHPRYQPSKFGQTSNMRTRYERYCTQHGRGSIDLIVVVDFDSLPPEVDVQLVDLYNEFMRTILGTEAVPEEMKTFVRILIEREGETHGPKRRIVLSIIETGIQKFFGLEPGPSEAFMFDESVFEERKAYVDDASAAVVRLLVRLGVSGKPASMAMDSWATAYAEVKVKNWNEDKDGPTPTLLSSQIVGSEYVSGEAHVDALDYPANAGSTDRDLAFSTMEYTARGKCALSFFYSSHAFFILEQSQVLVVANSSSHPPCLSFCSTFVQQMFCTVATELASGFTRSGVSEESICSTTTATRCFPTTNLKMCSSTRPDVSTSPQ